jgi:hypothetical protein
MCGYSLADMAPCPDLFQFTPRILAPTDAGPASDGPSGRSTSQFLTLPSIPRIQSAPSCESSFTRRIAVSATSQEADQSSLIAAHTAGDLAATLKRTVAVKLPRPGEMGAVLLAEARRGAGLRHPSIVTVHEVGRRTGSRSSCPTSSTARTWAAGWLADRSRPPSPSGAGADGVLAAHRTGAWRRAGQPVGRDQGNPPALDESVRRAGPRLR